MEKVALNKLTEQDLEKLVENDTVWGKVVDSISEDTNDMLDDFITRLEGVGNYIISDSTNYNNCLIVSDYYLFLSSLKEACGYNTGVLSDKQLDTATNLVSKYENSDNADEIAELQAEMDVLADKYADILLNSMVADYDVIHNAKYVKEYMQDELSNMYPDGAYYNREDNLIYYLTTD